MNSFASDFSNNFSNGSPTSWEIYLAQIAIPAGGVPNTKNRRQDTRQQASPQNLHTAEPQSPEMPMSVSRERGDSTSFLQSPVLGAQEQLWENSVPDYSVTGFFLPVVPGSGGFSSLALLPWLFRFTSLGTGYDKWNTGK